MGTVLTPVVVSDTLVTLEEAKEYFAIEALQTTRDEMIVDLLHAVDGWVQKHCGRSFRKTENDTRRFWPNAKGSIYLKDLWGDPAPVIEADIAGDRSYSEVVAASGYELLPYHNGDVEVNGPAIFQEVSFLNSAWWYGFNPSYPIRVTGDWGYVETDGRAPFELRRACLMLAARWFKREETALMVAQMPAMGFRQLTRMDEDVLRLLDPFVHISKRRVLQ